MTWVVVKVLCNQPEAFASDLGDNQSRYLCPFILLFGALAMFVFIYSALILTWLID